jgi:serine/threonine-protein kinase ULK/ATG1
MVKQIGKYNLEKRIGQGQFGTVYLGRQRDTENVVAVKEISRARLTARLLKQMEQEIKTMKGVSSPNVIQLADVLMTKHNVYLVMEYCSGGDLDQYLQAHRPVEESLCKRWIKQLVSAFLTLQEHRILHRDLKLGNLLLSNSDAQIADVKLADFGFAKILNEGSVAQTQLGTPMFMAPEIFNEENYSYKVDVWSLGVISYELLTGEPAFKVKTIAELRQRQKEPVQFPESTRVSPEAKDLVSQMLTYDPQARPSFEQLQTHPFLQDFVAEHADDTARSMGMESHRSSPSVVEEGGTVPQEH